MQADILPSFSGTSREHALLGPHQPPCIQTPIIRCRHYIPLSIFAFLLIELSDSRLAYDYQHSDIDQPESVQETEMEQPRRTNLNETSPRAHTSENRRTPAPARGRSQRACRGSPVSVRVFRDALQATMQKEEKHRTVVFRYRHRISKVNEKTTPPAGYVCILDQARTTQHSSAGRDRGNGTRTFGFKSLQSSLQQK